MIPLSALYRGDAPHDTHTHIHADEIAPSDHRTNASIPAPLQAWDDINWKIRVIVTRRSMGLLGIRGNKMTEMR